NDERALVALLQASFEMLKIIMAKPDTACLGAQSSIHQAGMEAVFAQNYLPLLGQRGYNGVVGLKPGSKENGILFAHKLCQLFFKLYVDMQGAIQKPRPATPGTELGNGGNGGFFYLRMVGQIQIIIGAEHQDLTIAQRDFTVAT